MTATADQELVFAGPGALAQLVRERQVEPRELVELCLRQIEATDPKLNAFRVTLAEQAVAEADALATERLEGPLAGVPIAIKDDMPIAGQSVTRGSRSHGPPESADGELVRRLRAAGAIPIGITNVPELMIFPWTASAANGVTRNPWNLGRTPGGSSGGSAAAVASGMVPCATGSDGGGSIRIPAACCGLVGMKPTRGRVSSQPAREGWLGLSTYGALARTVSDSALLLDVIHGALPGDIYQAAPFTGSYVEAAAGPPGRLRIATSRKLPPGFLARLSADQRGAWERTGKLLTELGHEVIERDPAYGMAGIEFTQMWLRGILEESRHVPGSHPAGALDAPAGRRGPAPGPRSPAREAAGRARHEDRARPRAVAGGRRATDAGAGEHRDRGRRRLRQVRAARHRQGIAVHAALPAVQPHRPAVDRAAGWLRSRRAAAQRAAGGRARGPRTCSIPWPVRSRQPGPGRSTGRASRRRPRCAPAR